MTNECLSELLGILTLAKVKTFKSHELTIEFDLSALQPAPMSVPILDPKLDPKLDTPDPLPEDFKAQETMTFDQILNWSAPQTEEDAKKPAVPLTGDAPL